MWGQQRVTEGHVYAWGLHRVTHGRVSIWGIHRVTDGYVYTWGLNSHRRSCLCVRFTVKKGPVFALRSTYRVTEGYVNVWWHHTRLCICVMTPHMSMSDDITQGRVCVMHHTRLYLCIMTSHKVVSIPNDVTQGPVYVCWCHTRSCQCVMASHKVLSMRHGVTQGPVYAWGIHDHPDSFYEQMFWSTNHTWKVYFYLSGYSCVWLGYLVG